jgi:hypothetical protein
VFGLNASFFTATMIFSGASIGTKYDRAKCTYEVEYLFIAVAANFYIW